jgi:hypothetical protein
VPVYTGIIVVNPPGYNAAASKNPSKTVSTTLGGANTPAPPKQPKPPKPTIPDPDKPVK